MNAQFDALDHSALADDRRGRGDARNLPPRFGVRGHASDAEHSIDAILSICFCVLQSARGELRASKSGEWSERPEASGAVKWLKHWIWKNITQDPEYEETQVPCPEITIEGIDQDLYAKLLAEATAAGAQFDGATATISGCTFDWNYDAEAGALRATCTKKPFYIGCDSIADRIQAIILKARGGI